jgi:hypothetical protein
MLRDLYLKGEHGRSQSESLLPDHVVGKGEEGADETAASGPLIPLLPTTSSRPLLRNSSYGILMPKPPKSCSNQSTLMRGQSPISTGMLGILT